MDLLINYMLLAIAYTGGFLTCALLTFGRGRDDERTDIGKIDDHA